ncbi:hypothetical protein BUZ79_03520 [Staphylococcus saprophyticus]|nr:hypothetical protein BUZ79_03520 [Staphylococcus saprophyticus]
MTKFRLKVFDMIILLYTKSDSFTQFYIIMIIKGSREEITTDKLLFLITYGMIIDVKIAQVINMINI